MNWKKIINRFVNIAKRLFRSLGRLSRSILIVLMFITIARTITIIFDVLPQDLPDWWAEALSTGVTYVAIKEGALESLSFKAVFYWITILTFVNLFYKHFEEMIYAKQSRNQ